MSITDVSYLGSVQVHDLTYRAANKAINFGARPSLLGSYCQPIRETTYLDYQCAWRYVLQHWMRFEPNLRSAYGLSRFQRLVHLTWSRHGERRCHRNLLCERSSTKDGNVDGDDYARYSYWTIHHGVCRPTPRMAMDVLATLYCESTLYRRLILQMNAAQFVGYIFFGPETLYRPITANGLSPFKQQYLSLRRIDPTPLKVRDFVDPIMMLRYWNVLIPAIAYAIVFNFTLVLMTVEIPALLGQIFHLNPQETGINFLGLLVGSTIGELISGPLSDYLRNRKTRKTPGRISPPPEYRIWLSYFGFPTAIAGIVIFCVRMVEATPGQWNITPIIGLGIGGFGVQVLTTILITCIPQNVPPTDNQTLPKAILDQSQARSV